MTSIQQDIETRLAQSEPGVEVLLAEVVGANTMRIFIDDPKGVTLALCERVTRQLGELRSTYTLEVSSPGRERPLSKPDHFRRFLGHRARVRTREPLGCPGAQRRSFTGELVGASESEITVAADSGVVSIAYADIHRSNLVGE